jgi:aromatic-L-amino-acid decarboxylase
MTGQFSLPHLGALTHLDEVLQAGKSLESTIASGPIVPCVTPAEIRSHLASRYDFKKPLGLDEVCADVEHLLQTWQVQVTHPRYFGLFNPSVTPASIVADTIVAMYNPQLATWRTSPAANEIERHTLGWLMSKFGLPSRAVANFTSGGAEANLSAVIVAMTRAFPQYGEDGIQSLTARPTIYMSTEAHHSFSKIAHMTGLGRRAIRTVSTDRQLKIDIADLARQIASDRDKGFSPFMVVGTAGTTSAGVIDPLPAIANYCRSEGLWFHVDAAWGGAAVVSPRLRNFLEGIENADSITCDAHKWFSVPMGAGMFFCRHANAVDQAFRAETSYMPPKTAGWTSDPYTTTAQWSRRFIGLKLFLSLANKGESGYASLIEHQTQMGDALRECLRRTGWRIVNSTPLPLVCFTRDGLNTSDFLSKLYERQIAWMSEVSLAGGPPVLRACVTSFQTTEADIECVTREMSKLL